MHHFVYLFGGHSNFNNFVTLIECVSSNDAGGSDFFELVALYNRRLAVPKLLEISVRSSLSSFSIVGLDDMIGYLSSTGE